MQFKNPEILYFLFLLIIPILVHLFQLRRFKKEYFTNVRFLRELSIQTRKSSKLKKYLLLATRMLLLAAIVIAFAQPFFPAKQAGAANELFIVLDNSYSMQARGKQGELLRRSIEDLLASVPEGKTFSLLTNDDAFWDTDIKSVRPDLQQLPYSALPFDLESQMARINTRRGAARDIVIITDAAGIDPGALKSIDSLATVRIIVPKAEQKSNVSIDTVYIGGTSGDFYEIAIGLRATGNQSAVPVALHDRGKLVAKTMAAKFENKKTLSLTIPKAGFHGYASIADNGMAFDNKYFFSITPPQKTSVMSLGEANKAAFMQRIFTGDEFQYANFELRSLDYNAIGRQDVVVLNELQEIPAALQSTLQAFADAGGTLIAIPPAEGGAALNALLGKVSGIRLGQPSRSSRQVTRIAFSHPLYAQVFEKKIDNFQYPVAGISYALTTRNSPALSFEGGEAFLATERRGLGYVYAFASPLSREHGNFQLSPLIVPTFYNMARLSSQGGLQAMAIGADSPLVIDAEATGEGVLEVRGEGEKFIPVQQLQGGKARLTFADNPKTAGNFEVMDKEKTLSNISFNYGRGESFAQADLSILGDFETAENAGAVFDALASARTGTEIWKWFVILALLFALCEMLIQKFVK